MFRATCIVALILVSGATACAEEGKQVRFKGYYKNLLSKSKTSLGENRAYILGLNRLRLEVEGNVAPQISFDVQYDNEVLVGDYLTTQEFDQLKTLSGNQYWQAESNYSETSEYYARHKLYRAFITFTQSETDVRIGRQRIAWGTGRFWSPLDILNPISPIQLERDERPGVDALLVERKLDPLSRFSVVYAPQHQRAESNVAAQLHGNSRGIDYSLVWGKLQRDHLLGLDIATQFGDAGLRGELSYTRTAIGKRYYRTLLGVDYAFRNTLTLTAELYYDGNGSKKETYDFNQLLTGKITNLARRYAGFYASYEITPLIKWKNYLVINLDDRSRYFSPSLSYSLNENMEWAVGAQHFHGTSGSEYARLNDVFYTQLQWYF